VWLTKKVKMDIFEMVGSLLPLKVNLMHLAVGWTCAHTLFDAVWLASRNRAVVQKTMYG
jgi:hypothetical protein